MTDQNLAKDLLQYTGWSGSRADLIALIERLEKAEPRARMLQSKKAPYPLLPINPRRIQWFITKGMMPKPLGHKYDYAHVIFYWATIVARKREKLPFERIEGLSRSISIATASSYIENGSAVLRSVQASAELDVSKTDVSQYALLQSLGREEGRPLRSELLRFAITPWCHVMINKSRMFEIDRGSIEVLTEAFRTSLEEISKENSEK